MYVLCHDGKAGTQRHGMQKSQTPRRSGAELFEHQHDYSGYRRCTDVNQRFQRTCLQLYRGQTRKKGLCSRLTTQSVLDSGGSVDAGQTSYVTSHRMASSRDAVEYEQRNDAVAKWSGAIEKASSSGGNRWQSSYRWLPPLPPGTYACIRLS